jgi:beta-lactamase class A
MRGHSRVGGEQEFTPLHRLSLLKALPEWRDTRRWVTLHVVSLSQRGDVMNVQSRIEDVLAPLGIDVGFSATHLPTGQTVAIAPQRLFPTASVYKIPVLVEVYRQAETGRFTLSDRLAMADTHRIIGSGVLQKLDAGVAPTIRDLAMLMIIISDNTATHMLQDLVGTGSIHATMRQLGLLDIHVVLSMPGLFAHGYGLPPVPPPSYDAMQSAARESDMAYDGLAFQRTANNTTSSAADMSRLCAMIFNGKVASPASCADMMEILRAQQLRERVPRFLPVGAAANKTGTFRKIRNDAGVLMRGEGDAISFGLFTYDPTPLPPANSRLLAQRNALINDAMAEIGAILWDHLGKG